MMRQILSRIAKKFSKANDGIAAVEFALVAPVMIAMFFGTVELSDAMRARANVTNVASAGADLIAQQTTINDAEMINVLAALDTILFPYPPANASIVISSVVDNGAGAGRVAWSDAQHGTPRGVNSVITTLPTGLIVSGSGTSVIMAEVTYTYSSPSMTLLKTSLTMRNTFYAKPRRSLVITRTAS